jgi:hypothetical protein
MHTLACTVTFASGESVTARVSSPAPEAAGKVFYSGATQLLGPDAPRTARCSYLDVWMRTFAREHQGKLETLRTGEYDVWAL